MLDLVAESFDSLFTWPTLPFSVLLVTVTMYWLVVACGFLALDSLDFNFDIDADIDPSVVEAGFLATVFSWGFVPLRWLNLGSVPLMIWGSVFTLVAWVLSRWMNAGSGHDEFVWNSDLQIIGRDAVIAAVATKFFTNPLRGLFDFEEPNRLETLIGRTVVVTTNQVDDVFGEVEVTTDGAPLRLNARADGQRLAKGDSATILAYEADNKVYVVAPIRDAT